jgi:DNA processing protein
MGIRMKQVSSSALEFLSEFRSDQTDLPRKIVAKILETRRTGEFDELQRIVAHDLLWFEAEHHSIVSIFDDDYPFLLLQIHDPPLCLYIAGNREILVGDQVAVVGSRKATAPGKKIATKFASDLSERNIVVTSGLAFGIDAAAHAGALQRTGRTIAVLGTGCNVIYPRQHERLTLRVLEQGLIISEFPLGTPGFPANFPQRNRIVTGLTMGTLVVEATMRSGSLISARLAMEQAREVFAVPGSIYSAQSAGCHQLIKDGAKLTQTVEDIIEELPGYLFLNRLVSNDRTPDAPVKHPRVLQHLGASPISADELVELTGIPISDLLGALVELEINGAILHSSQGYVLAKRSD